MYVYSKMFKPVKMIYILNIQYFIGDNQQHTSV